MRVVVLGGTNFIGRRIAEDLHARGDEVTVVHRGVTEPSGWLDCRHLHAVRADFSRIAADVRALRPEAIIDTHALTRADVEAVLPHLPDTRLIVLSSMDVYRAFELLDSADATEPVPISEYSALRRGRYPHREHSEDYRDYEKLHVEPRYIERGGTVLRLAMIYGEHDPQRREEFILRRVRAGRRQIPVGPGSWLWTRCYVGDVASAVLGALATPAAAGQVLNVGEPVTATISSWARQILAAAGHAADLIPAPEGMLPADMWPTKEQSQHLLVDSRRAMDLLGWRPSDPGEAIARSVRWHLAHPPQDADPDFAEDDQALAADGGQE